MQAAMDITAKFCQKEMEEYGACVASNQTSWQEQCHHLKVKVAQCTSSQNLQCVVRNQERYFTPSEMADVVEGADNQCRAAVHELPVIRKIRADCGGEFAEFERCLRENQSSAQACSVQVARFLTCANTVDIKGLVNPEPQPT